MSLPTTALLLQSQTSLLFRSLRRPTSPPFSLSTPLISLSPYLKTPTFPRESPSLSSSFHFSPQFQHQQQQFNNNSNDDNEDDNEEEEEHVIGDCIVFEEGAFEDPYLQQTFDAEPKLPTKKKKSSNNKSKAEVIKPEDLVPEKWKEAQAEINITKKERRAIAREMEFGRRVEKRKQGLVPIRSVKADEYTAYRSEKLSQLKPIVLDNPTFFPASDEEEKEGGESREGEKSSSSRVAPRNPKLAVYGARLDDISEFFSSGHYDPQSAQNNEGPRKLFTKEEKVLLNRRIPELSAATSDKWLPLHTLAASGEFYLVNALLKHTGDINIQDKDGLTAVFRAVLSKKEAIFNYLLRESANPFIRDKDGATLMHYAVRTASIRMIKILLLYNVDINLQDNDGWTPLHLAVQTRRTDVVRLLLIKGADKTLKNQDGLTPLDLCLYSGQDTRTFELIKLIKQLPMSR